MLRLSKFSKFQLPSKLLTLLKDYEFVFNPSYCKLNEGRYLAIRLCKNKKAKVIAKIFYWEEDFLNEIFELDLSIFFKNELNLIKVADPKIFVLDKKMYCTFNTGQPSGLNNQIFLCRIEKNTIVDYYESIYKDRVRVEKNWMFFTKNNQLYCLYNLYPFTILKVDKIENKCIYLVKENQVKDFEFKNYSIGTPIIKIENSYYFIGHKKMYYRRKRLYFGRLFKIMINDEISLSKEKNILFHSFKSILGNSFKFNRRLISCTYFSGFYLNGNKLIIGYGINDVGWNIVEVNLKKLISQ